MLGNFYRKKVNGAVLKVVQWVGILTTHLFEEFALVSVDIVAEKGEIALGK